MIDTAVLLFKVDAKVDIHVLIYRNVYACLTNPALLTLARWLHRPIHYQ